MSAPSVPRDAPLRVGLVGLGYWGTNLARNIAANDRCLLAAISDVDPALVSRLSSRHPSARPHDDLAGMLEDDEVDAVVLATPASTHAELGTRVLRTSRHLMVEKPLAMTVDDATSMEAEARTHGVFLMVGHTFIHSPAIAYLRGVVERGELGDILYLSFQRRSLGRVRRDCDVLWNLAPHDVSIANHLLGSPPIDATGRSFSYLQDGIADVFFGTLSYPSGVGVSLHLSWLDPKKTRRLTIVGSERMAEYDDVSVNSKVMLFDSSAELSPATGLGDYESVAEFHWTTRSGDIRIPKLDNWEPLAREIEAFAEGALDGRPSGTDAGDGVEVVRTLDALDRSSRRAGIAVDLEHHDH